MNLDNQGDVCDIWNLRRHRAAERVKDTFGTQPKVYHRIEQVLEDKDIEAVIIAAADHQHAGMLKRVVEAGKDIYCEKPMGNVLSDTNVAFAAVMKSECIVQIGTQRRSDPQIRTAAKIMQQGRIGAVAKIDVIANAYSPYRW